MKSPDFILFFSSSFIAFHRPSSLFIVFHRPSSLFIVFPRPSSFFLAPFIVIFPKKM